MVEEILKEAGFSYIDCRKIGNGGINTVYVLQLPELRNTSVPASYSPPVFTRVRVCKKEDSDIVREGFRVSRALLGIPGLALDDHLMEVDDYVLLIGNYMFGVELLDICDCPPLSRHVSTLRHVAQTVERVHARNVVHRDITLSNIIGLPNGRAGENCLIDWDIAAEVGSEYAKRILGTPAYLPPEIFKRHSTANPQYDIYALGVCLLTVLNGVDPFYGEESPTRCSQSNNARLNAQLDLKKGSSHLRNLHRDLSKRFPGDAQKVSKAARHILGKLLMPDPRKRVSTMSCARKMFERFEKLIIKEENRHRNV